MNHILEDPEFQKILQGLAVNQGVPHAEIYAEASKYLKELYTLHEPLLELFSIKGADLLLARAYEKTIDVNSTEIKELGKIMRRFPVAFVMTHKTYIDMIVLAVVLSRHGLPLPYTFAGINMSFLGLGELGRKVGAIFIRRSFKDNHVYKASLRHFISHLVKEKSHFMWAIEGTRSRTGKLVWPKMGILKYIVEAEKQAGQEVKYVPVSVVYDLIPDVREMTAEGRGKSKKPESLLWFIDYLRKMGDHMGKISLRFGAPLERLEAHHAQIPDENNDDPHSKYTLPRFAFELIYHINRITPVTTASLICITLLSTFARTKSVIESDIIELMRLIESHKPDALVDRGKPIGESVQKALNLLIQGNLVQKMGEGIKAKYAIVTRNYLSATYYGNMAVHHLYHRAFIELTFLQMGKCPPEKRHEQFWKEIMDLRDLFKFEFFYSTKAEFSDEIESNLHFIHPDWHRILSDPKTNFNDLIKSKKVLVAHVVLYTYIEAYRVVAQALRSWDVDIDLDEKKLLDACKFVGEEMHWQGRIHRVESVSKPFLLNGIRLVKNRSLFTAGGRIQADKVNGLISQLDQISDRIKFLQNLVLEKPDTKAIIPLDRNIVPGSKTAGITAEVVDGESGSHVGAFFDLDRTLIRGFSAKEFFQNRLLSGRMKPQEIVAQFAGVLVYAMGNRNYGGLASIGARGVNGLDEQIFIDVGEEVYLKHLADEIYPESRALVAAHLAKGHTVAIISAATPYQVNPIARDLNIEHVLCTRMRVVDGKFTGEIVEPACWGEGKSLAAIGLAKQYDLDLTKSHFYTDSIDDLPLMELVGFPHALNPDNELSEMAFKNDWPVSRFSDEARPGVTNVVRTALAFGSLIPAAMAGFSSGLLSLSRRDGVNNTMALVGELGTAFAGIKMAIKGEEHLWSDRPAVFIFNHQSNADFFIAAKLLKRDTVAIAKKELESMPIIGQLFKASGVIFVDRKDREKAIEAMTPAVDALKNGTSVAIAPEGTRSRDYRLGSFKKGAFHLAMQAGVPIVPMIIKNAHDVMPKGSALLRPTVLEVVIKAPIQTSDWKRKDLDSNIKAVREIYLKELGQMELSLTPPTSTQLIS